MKNEEMETLLISLAHYCSTLIFRCVLASRCYLLNVAAIYQMLRLFIKCRCNLLCQRHGLAVPRAGDRSYAMGSIHGWSRSRLTYVTGGC